MNDPNTTTLDPNSAPSFTMPRTLLPDTSTSAAASNSDLVIDTDVLRPEWQSLPVRAHTVFRYVSFVTTGIPTLFICWILHRRLGLNDSPTLWIGGVLITGILLALWLAYRRYRYTYWKLDGDGFAVKRGRLWQWETRVPTTRVQHLDLKRGPLERMYRLSSLILHTAGTRHNAVHVSGMDHADAERLRNYLSQQIERRDRDEPDFG